MSAQREQLPAPANRQNWRIILEAIQSLFLYGATGLVALGYYINEKIAAPVTFFPILWFAGGLFVYNLDRFIPDAADRINLPERSQFREIRKWLIAACFVTLIVTPLYNRGWVTLGLILGAIGFSSMYCLKPPGFSRRIKDVFLLKSVVPAWIILLALTAPFWTEKRQWVSATHFLPLFGGIFVMLLINILIFDQRDIEGDSAAGVKTVANRLPEIQFFHCLCGLLILQFIFVFLSPNLEMATLAIFSGIIIVLAKKRRSPGFYHWAVDGLLFLPLICQKFEKLLK